MTMTSPQAITSAPNVGAFLDHLRTASVPFMLRNDGQGPVWEDAALHVAQFTADPELYTLLATGAGVTESQRARMLFLLLLRSRTETPAALHDLFDQVVGLLLAALPADTVLTVFLALRRARANHKHTARAILTYILNHPQVADLVSRRRPTVADCLEHALGKNVARGAVRLLGEPGAQDNYAERVLLRLARSPEVARRALAGLYGRAPEKALVGDATPAYSTAHLQAASLLAGEAERPKTVTPTNRGDIAATLVHLYTGGPSPELEAALDGYVRDAAARLPRFAGRLAVVLDTSASLRGYGEREYTRLAQSLALTRVLALNCAELRVYPPLTAALPTPEGATDLAGPLLDALAAGPDLVAVVSDGYENTYGGDLAAVTAALPGAGVNTPVVFCNSKFSYSDDLSLRRPAPVLPELEFWHENDFADLFLSLFARAGGDAGEPLRVYLRDRLGRLEREVTRWTSAN